MGFMPAAAIPAAMEIIDCSKMPTFITRCGNFSLTFEKPNTPMSPNNKTKFSSLSMDALIES
jgi:hypothetical protein